jgi:succinoglycan biosynthesis protein ExoH
VEADISRRIAIARYLAIVAVVFIHIQPTERAELSRLLDNAGFEFIRTFLIDGLFKYALPVLTAISGWLLFSSGLDQKYSKLVAKKTQTLLIPLMVWNIPVAIGIYFAQKYGVLGAFLTQLYPFNAHEWLNAVLSVTHVPVNAPLYFLRDLFVIALFAPVVGLVLRTWPYLGAVLVAFIYWFNLDGVLVLENRLIASFYIGGMAAVLGWNLKRLDQYAIPLLVSMIAGGLVIAITGTKEIEWIRALSPFWIWPIFSLLEKSKYADFFVRASNKSFFIFVSHSLILFVLWKLYQPVADSSHYPLFWVISPFIVVAFCHLTQKPFELLTPRLASLALGNRVEGYGGKRSTDWPSNWERVPVGIEQVDLHGPLLHVNRKLCDMLGYSREELEKLSFRDITHPDDLESEEKLLSQLIAGEIRSYSIEKRYLHKNGTAIPVRVTSSQVHRSAPSRGYRISIIEDIAHSDATALPQVVESLKSRAKRFSLSGRWSGLNETIRRAIAECLAYHERERAHGESLKLRTML